MAPVIHYECLSELLPVVEAALAAHGYAITEPLQKSVGGGHALVMGAGSASILLAHPTDRDRAQIEVWGTARDAAAHFLESLPVKLRRCHRSGT
jgi:hypothetical protein